MCIEPIELWLDVKALRRGLVYPVDPDTDPSALLVQDSGMVPVSTQIAIVNPETNRLCHVGEYGEIWVHSEACVKAFYGSKQEFDLERFNGKTVDGDASITYVRTGDLGFLHNVTRPIGPGGSNVDMQVLFVLGGVGETFEVNGLSHFPIDIEQSVEKCHRNIVNGGCAVFQAGGLVVVLVEVARKAYLASLVPVVVDTILNEHQVVVDIVAFVSYGDFPRSRLGEKQRGKILASWVTRKMRTIAQFGIRDPDTAADQLTEVPESRPVKRNTLVSNTLRNSSIAETAETLGDVKKPLPFELHDAPYPPMSPDKPLIVADDKNGNSYTPTQTGISEMPTFDDELDDAAAESEYEAILDGNMPQESEHEGTQYTQYELAGDDDYYDPEIELDADYAPTNGGLRITNPEDYSGGIYQRDDESTPRSTPTTTQRKDSISQYGSEYSWAPTPTSATHSSNNAVELPTEIDHHEQPNPFLNDIPPGIPSFDMFPSQHQRPHPPPPSQGLPASPAPPAKGREILPSQQKRYSSNNVPHTTTGGGGLRVTNNTSPGPPIPPKEPHEEEENEDWPQEALRYNQYTGGGGSSKQPSSSSGRLEPGGGGGGKFGSVAGSISRRYDGSGYDDDEY